ATVRELQSGHDVADRVHAGNVRGEALVGENEAAVHGDPDLFEAEAGGRRSAAHRDEEEFGLEGLPILEGDDDPVIVLGDALEAHAEVEVDAALAEGTLELLADRFVLVGDE